MKPIWAAHVLIAEAPVQYAAPLRLRGDGGFIGFVVLEQGGGVQFQIDDDYYSGYLERDEALALAYAIIRNYGKTS